jgi:hypothetical protein
MFSLKSLLFIVAVAGLGAAGLIHRTQLWASAMLALTLAMLLLAICRAWFAPQGRVFWGPFALTGAVYLAIVSLQPLLELHYNLPTTQIVMYGLDKTQTPTWAPSPFPSPYYAPTVSNPPVTIYATPTTALPGVAYGEYEAVATVQPVDSAGVAPTNEPTETATPPAGEFREHEVVTFDASTNTERRAVRLEPADGSAAGAPAPLGAPIFAGPVMPAPASTYTYSYSRSMLFQMATSRDYGNDFATEAKTFLWVAQCLWCLFLAFAMGLICSWLFRGAEATGLRPVGP